VDLLDERHGGNAGLAPRGPEVEENHLALERVERDFLAVGVLELEVGGGVAGLDLERGALGLVAVAPVFAPVVLSPSF
jgi:hypothetical protein